MKPIKPPTQEEIRDLTSLLSSGEPYGILLCDQNSTNKEITKRYRDLAKKYHPDKQKRNGITTDDGGDMMTKVNNAYKILSNERLKEIYDTYGDIRAAMNSEDGDDYMASKTKELRFQKIFTTGLSLLFHGLSIPFVNISTIVHSQTQFVKPRHVFSSVVKENGFFGGLYRGSFFSVGVSVIELIREESVKRVSRSLQLSATVQKTINWISRALVNYPIQLICDLVLLAPAGMSTYSVISDIILRADKISAGNIILDGTNKQSSLQWKNLFYSIGYSLSIFYVNKLIKRGIMKLDSLVYDGSVNNPKSKFYRYSNYLMSHSVFRVGLIVLLQNPLLVIQSQYPTILLNCYQRNISIIPSPNPFTIANSIYRNGGGFFKFFNGLIPFYFSRLLEYVSEECSIEDELFDDDDDDDIV